MPLYGGLRGGVATRQQPVRTTAPTGTDAANFAITGPGWSGTLPSGIKAEYKAPTSIVWVLGRTYSTGSPDDYAAVNAIQALYKLTPLSAWGKPYTPPDGVVNPAWDTKDRCAIRSTRWTAQPISGCLPS